MTKGLTLPPPSRRERDPITKETMMKTRMTPQNTLTAYLFLAPALLGLFFLTIFPIIGVVGISLTNWSGLEFTQAAECNLALIRAGAALRFAASQFADET